jgi:predicted DNA-binding transcriptional regulator YafY
MNLSKSAFRRYKVIDSLLRNPMRKYPTMEEIIEACIVKLDFEPSPETIQKDIANMRSPAPDGFDAPIHYNRLHKGYEYLDPNYSLAGVSLRQDELDAIHEAVELIRSIGSSRISENFTHAVEKMLSATLEIEQNKEDRLPVLQMMTPPPSRGFEYFDLMFKACKERIPLSFIHYSYKKRRYKHVILHPFLIKEFENRWYIIGYSENHKDIRTFGLDRITDPLLLDKTYISTERQTKKSFLNEVYGVFPIPEAVKETVEIRVSSLGTHYYQAYPLHESQHIRKHNHGDSIITFELIPSVELARHFLSQGYHVTILKPEWFKKITQNLSNEKYQQRISRNR